MHNLVVLNLGKGNWQTGFPAVTAQLWESEGLTPMQFTGSLPPMPTLDTLYQGWQLLYESLYNNLALRRSRTANSIFEIDDKDEELSHISQSEFQNICHELHHQINRWLSADSFRTIEIKLRTHLTPKDEISLVIAAQDSSILKLPWCLWDFLSDYPHAEIALSPPEYTRSLKRATDKAKKKVKILGILGDGSGINIARDQQILEKLPDANIKFLVEPTSQELHEQLWEPGWDILFFAGHSSSQGKGRIQVNARESLTIDQLKYGLKKAISNGLKLAIFNSCDGLGLAQDLADLHLPQVIVMREPVPDRVAQEFLKHFLTAFSGGQSLYTAVRDAREKLQGLEAQFPCAAWLPVICQNPAEVPSTWNSWRGKKNPLPLFPNFQESRKILLSSLSCTLLVAGVRFLGMLAPLELSAFDMLMRSRIEELPDNRLLIVRVTPEEIQDQGSEPRIGSLSDSTLTKLLQKLEKYRPATIGLDIYRDFPAKQPELIKQLQQNGRLIGICKRPDRKDDPTGTLPPPEIPEARLGFSDFVQDYDGAVRRHLLFMSPNTTSRCTASYSLSAQLAFQYLYSQNIKPQFTPDKKLQLAKKLIPPIANRTGGYQPVDATRGQILLNYRALPHPEIIAEKVSLKELFNDRVNPKAIQNRIILIGVTNPSMGDLWSTPYGAGSSEKIPGVLVHAHMVSQILSYVLDNRPLLWVWSGWVEIAWIGAWSLIGGALAWRFRKLASTGIAVFITVIILIGGCWLLLTIGGWVPLVPAFIALLSSDGVIFYLLHKNRL